LKKPTFVVAAALVALAALAIGPSATAGGGDHIKTDLKGYLEVPAVSTVGRGAFTARINAAGTQIAYRLSYTDLEASVTQAHIHFAQRSVNGAISVFLCSNLGNGPAGTQPCPAAPATITGTITASNVTALAAAQGLDAGEVAELIRAVRAGRTYVNVHSTKFPGGEIRAQLNDKDQRDG